jgi:hypothetical protein
MKRNLATIVCIFLLGFSLISRVYAAEDSLLNQFLGSPLLVLTAIIVVDIIAFLYRKFRK